MTDTPSVWLLVDDRMSHRSQLTGVAEALGAPWIVKELRYNRGAALANGVFGARLWHLTPEARLAIAPPWPDLVMAAGRRSAPAALAIQKRAPGIKLVQLMWPDVAPHRFHLIAVPQNDTRVLTGGNILRTFGAPHAVSRRSLMMEAARFHSQVARLPSPRIAVLIGGSSKSMRYEEADFKALAAYASAEAERLNGSLLITTSPRTDPAAEKVMKPILTAPHLLYSLRSGAENPYTAFLGLADAVIVTGDSVSMCSEACSTGKPVYIFVPPHVPRDGAAFREMLFAQGLAKPHTYPIRLDWQPGAMPTAAVQVADAIRTRLFNG